MEIKLSPEESEEYFYNSLCNLSGYLSGYGLELTYKHEAYDKARTILLDKGVEICYEDVLMQILHQGDELTLKDHEGDGDMSRSITLKDVHERVQKTPLAHLQDMINETDDVTTADVIIQTCFYESIIFG